MALDIINVPYGTVKSEVVKKSLRVYYVTLSEAYTVLAGSASYMLRTIVRGSDRADFETTLRPVAVEVTCDAEARGLCTPVEADMKPLVAVAPAEGLKSNKISPNWCDKTTWYPNSVRVEDETADCQNVGTYTIYKVDHYPMIDSYHGKITGEDYRTDGNGVSFRVVVKVNGTQASEQDPHSGTGGDYTINYSSGEITFLSALQSTDAVTVSYHYANGSLWVLKPAAGEVLKIKRAECQFSEDVILTDSMVYDLYGNIEAFAPAMSYHVLANVTFTQGSAIVTGSGTQFTQKIRVGQYLRLVSDGPECYVPVETVDSNTQITLQANYGGSSGTGAMAYSYSPTGVVPAGTLIQLVSPDYYKSMWDYYNDANGCYPIVPALGGSGWRGSTKAVYSFPWDFQTTTDLYSSKGMELRITLEHDHPFEGTYATATFYCLRTPE